MVYSRIIRAVHGESCSLISAKWTTRIFVASDMFCLLVQSSGSGMLAQAKNAQLGDSIIVAGLGLQILMFVGFMLCCSVFHIRFRRHLAKTGTTSAVRWEASLHMLYWTSVAILVRNMYRVVEFVMGSDQGYLADHEWPLYVFDGALMVLVMAGFFLWYPSQLRPTEGEPGVDLS